MRRGAAATIRHATGILATAPATATAHARRPTIRSGRIGLRFACVITATIPIITPFVHVATHIVDAQLVGRLGGYGVSLVTTVIIIPSHVAEAESAITKSKTKEITLFIIQKFYLWLSISEKAD